MRRKERRGSRISARYSWKGGKLYQEARQLSCREETSRSPEVCETRHATNRNPIIHGPTSVARHGLSSLSDDLRCRTLELAAEFACSRVSLRTRKNRVFFLRFERFSPYVYSPLDARTYLIDRCSWSGMLDANNDDDDDAIEKLNHG